METVGATEPKSLITTIAFRQGATGINLFQGDDCGRDTPAWEPGCVAALRFGLVGVAAPHLSELTPVKGKPS